VDDRPAVLVVNASGVIQSWSEGAEELLGHGRSTVLGKTLDVIVPEAFRQRHWAGFNRAMASGSSFIDGQAAILPVLCGDRQVRRLAGRLSLMRDPSGEVVGAMAIYTTPDGLEAQLPVIGD
jgi:PAS domain S-box-containing protein